MTIAVKIIADSISPDGIRLTTMQLRYPRFIHSEFMTHRQFSRNASSSRAIPVKRMIEDVRSDPAIPLHWGANQPGMQACEELTGLALEEIKWDWNKACEDAVRHATNMSKSGAHKQLVNRILEPYAHINVLVTATEWQNFYKLRHHRDAQPEMRLLASAMREAQSDSSPVLLRPGEWHTPYIMSDDCAALGLNLLYISAARCAKLSYLSHDGEPVGTEKDLALAQKLKDAGHWSPFEHQATPDKHETLCGRDWDYPDQHRNFRGWRQHRAMIGG